MLHSIEQSPSWRRGRFIVVTVVAMSPLFGCGGGGGSDAGPSDGTVPPGTGGAQTDTAPPAPPTTVSGTAVSASEITVSWSGATDNVGVASYKVYRNGTAIATVTSTSHADTGLSAGTQYCYDVSAADATGNESARSTQACATTTAVADSTPPTIASTRPASDGKDIAADAPITVTFSEAMNATTLTSATFTLVDARKQPVSGTVSYSGTTATFAPNAMLAAAETYTATIAAGVRDVAGNALAATYTFTFKTGLVSYELIAIGTDPPGDDDEFTLLTDVNEKGEVVGEAIRTSGSSQESLAFLWRDGRLIDLGALSGSVRDSRAQGVNDQSEVVGQSYPDTGLPGFIWREDEMTALGVDDAFAINNAGQVVGFVTRIQGGEAVGVPVVWRAGQMIDLDGMVNPWNLNEAGDVVGFSFVAQRDQASLWRAGAVTVLGVLPGSMGSQAFDVNSDGIVIGTSQFAPPTSATTYDRAFVWQSGRMTELPRAAASHTSSHAYGINDRGNAVGRSGSTQFSATLWLGGAAHDLNELVATDDALKPYVTLLEAREINNRGQIIAQGADSRRSGSFTGYLLTPKRAR